MFSRKFQSLYALAIFLFCVLTRELLERDPVTHILVQLPLLTLVGWLAASALRDQLADGGDTKAPVPNDHGVSGLLVVLFAIAYWMLPRSIDAALDNTVFEGAKFLSIPLLIGAPLAIYWPHAHPLLRGFLKANALSMLVVFAYLYTHAPVRICNNYLVSDQERLGAGFFYLAILLAIIWSVPLFFGTSTSERIKLSPHGYLNRNSQ